MSLLHHLAIIFNSITLCITLTACSISTQTKTAAQYENTKLTASQHFVKGKQRLDKILTEKAQPDGIAEWHLKQALDMQPDNLQYQITHYNAYIAAHSEQDHYDEAKALAHFNLLHPEIKHEAVTPAFVTYTQSKMSGENTETLLNHMLRATQQNPFNSRNWFYMAKLYGEKQQYWLAASSANIAYTIAPHVAEYSFEQGYHLNQLAQFEKCNHDEKKLIQRSATLFSEAARKDQENVDYLIYASDTYLKLGLYPIALAQAKDAYSLEKNAHSLRVLFNALYFQLRFNDAWKILDEMESSLTIKDSNLKTLQLWRQGELTEAEIRRQIDKDKPQINTCDTNESTKIINRLTLENYWQIINQTL